MELMINLSSARFHAARPLAFSVEAPGTRFLDWANARSEPCAPPCPGPPPAVRAGEQRGQGAHGVPARVVADLVGAGRDAHAARGPGDPLPVRADLSGLR